ncbi:putative pentatricopeptide repeat-containing protein At5g37570 [Pistacia vera]|uniref:putative pentatricopeptide repeat-containing protein At5g37570 n=1 Tax=Pistacia vera TaxID=55513 RepID=UPI0012632604|nr:putative pentatricopeptide repeat-containing protein At5g37570 [Pistacia vera]
MPAFSPRPIKIAITKSCSLPSIITLLKTSKLRTHLHQVHSHLIKKGLQQDHSLISHFISLCHSLGTSLSYSTSIFNQIITPSTFLWNTLLKGYSQRGCFIDILKYFIRMIREGGVPDKYTFPLVIKACSSELILRGGTAIHGAVIRLGLDDDVFVCTSLIDLYGKCKEIECARKVFDEMTNRNVVSWTAMVVGYVIVGDLAEGKKMFDLMPERNIVSWNALIGGLVKIGDMSSSRKLFDEMPERNVISYTTMIDGYAKSGDMASARLLFEEAPDRDIVAWSALVTGYAQNGQPDEAVKIFYEMYLKDVKPDEFIMVSLMSACSQLGSLELAKWVDFYLSRSEVDLSRGHVIASLIDMNAKCGNMDRAAELFEAMSNRDLISYCSMIQGLSIHGHGAQAVFLFNKMISEGLIPDEVAFTVILTACSHAGLVEEGSHYFESMQSVYSIVPSPDHYACMVDLLSRTGHLKEAYELLNSMPVEPHEGAWGALLGACKLHCDFELGELVAKRLFELEPLNAGSFVLLSDIYAAADCWLDVSLVRKEMKERGVRKIPGCSRI